MFHLGQPMSSQYGNCGGRQRDVAASGFRFRFLDDDAASDGLFDRSLDPHRAALEINILPTKSQQFSSTSAARDRKGDDGIDRLAVEGCENGVQLLRLQNLNLGFRNPRRRDTGGGIVTDELARHRVLERAMQNTVHMPDRSWRKALLEQLCVEFDERAGVSFWSGVVPRCRPMGLA